MAISRLAFVADDIETFTTHHDSTWVMMQAAHRLGHEVYYIWGKYLNKEAEFIQLSPGFFNKQEGHTLVLDETSRKSKTKIILDDFDYIFMRTDPPVNEEYIRQCKILLECKNAKILNRADSIYQLNEKLMILNFPDLITETIVTKQPQEIMDFLSKHRKIVIKPLDGFGGKGIFSLEHGDPEALIKLEQACKEEQMVQRYIPAIKEEGGKRIIVVNGEPIAGLLQIPPGNDFRSNLAVGSGYAAYQLNDRDREICSKIKSFLLEQGIYFAGVDIIGEYLSEINITSPGSLQEINFSQNLEGEELIEHRTINSLVTNMHPK